MREHREPVSSQAPAMDNPKKFMALVNGVFLRTFQKDLSITPEMLKEEVFAADDATLEGSLCALQGLFHLLCCLFSIDFDLTLPEIPLSPRARLFLLLRIIVVIFGLQMWSTCSNQ